MTEIYGGSVPDNAAATAMPDMLSSGVGGGIMARLGEGFAHAFPSLDLMRITAENVATTGIDPSTGMAIPAIREAPQLSPAEATERYGIPGALRFDSDVPESVAAEMNDRKREELARQDIINRSPLGPVAGTALQFAGSLPGIADPLMIASGFIPAVPAARAAIMGASLAGRAGLGAIQGAVAGAALTPVFAGIAKHDQEDYGAVDALLNIALGSVAGGVGQAAFGRAPGIHGETGGPDDALAHADPTATIAAAEAPAPVREAMLTGSIAALADDRPVDLPPEFEQPSRTTAYYSGLKAAREGLPQDAMGGVWHPEERRDWQAGWQAGIRGEPGTTIIEHVAPGGPDDALVHAAPAETIAEEPAELRVPVTAGAAPYERLPAEPLRLASWLQQQGGVIAEDDASVRRRRGRDDRRGTGRIAGAGNGGCGAL